MSYGGVSALGTSADLGLGSKAHLEDGPPTLTSSYMRVRAFGGHRFIQAMHFHGAAHGVSGLRILKLWSTAQNT